MPGAFEASSRFEYDPTKTADEIDAAGAEALRILQLVAESQQPTPVDRYLVLDIHRRWFESTFPTEAGEERRVVVANRKGTASDPAHIVEHVNQACDSWQYRRANLAPTDPAEIVEFIVTEANTLTVRVYDIHPFIDGNTRTTWHLRNYVLMLDGLRPLTRLRAFDEYESAWWASTPHDHGELDRRVLEALDADDR